MTDTAALTGRDYPAAEGQLDESVWLTLVDSVNAGKCTPFLGAGVAWPHLPTGKGLSTTLASEFDYPVPQIIGDSTPPRPFHRNFHPH